MDVTFYVNNSPSNSINKTLTSPFNVNLTMKRDTDKDNLVLILHSANFDYNYLHVQEYDKYYFIDNIEHIAKNVVKLHCSCDLLYTYKESILKSKSTFTRPGENGVYGAVSNMNATGVSTVEHFESSVTIEGNSIVLSTLAV